MGNSKLLRSNPIQTYKKREQTEQNNFPTERCVHKTEQKCVTWKQIKDIKKLMHVMKGSYKSELDKLITEVIEFRKELEMKKIILHRWRLN